MKTLVAGFGNLLLGDDGFGVEAIRALAREPLPNDTQVLEVGIGGFSFVLALIDRFDRAILFDAMQEGHPAGSLRVFSPAAEQLREGSVEMSPHLTEPLVAMRLAQRLGILPTNTTVVTCEAQSTKLGKGLSEPVRAAVPRAVQEVLVILKSG